MAVTFPLTLAQFFEALPIRSVQIFPAHTNSISRTRSGQFITAYGGPVLWRGRVVLARTYGPDARAANARISLAQHYDASFLVAHPDYQGPRLDPKGTALGSRTPQLQATPNNMRDIAINGLPAGYVLSVGDRLSWPYGSNPTRYAYHSVAIGGVANGSGVVTVEVTPILNAGSLVAGANIQMKKPIFRAKIDPDTVEIGIDEDIISEGSSFEFLQVLGN